MAEAPVLELDCEADGIDFLLKTGKKGRKVKKKEDDITAAATEESVEVEEEPEKEEENEENKENGEEAKEDGANNVEEEIDKLKSEHFSQTKPEEFCSENFKIELGGLPKYYPLSHLKKLLNNTLQLDAHRVKPGGMGRNVAYLNFKDEDARFKAMTVLTGYKWQGATLTAEKADPTKDPMLLAKIDFLKVPKKEYEQLPLNDRIQKAVTPYHGMSYEDQIKEKDKVLRQVFRKFGNELAQMNPELKKFVHWHKIRRKGQICELDDFVESPLKEGYRNKCEFTIGKNKESENPVVGFRVASYKEGTVEVGPVEHLKHINEKMKKIVKLMEQYLSTSKYEPYDPFSHLGVWRQLTIRTSQNDDAMIVVVIHPQEMEESEINDIKEDVTSFFTVGDGAEGGVTSIFFQQYAQKESGKEVEYEHVSGKTYIEETILGKTFKASPDAFLQVNTAACEILYQKIAEIADIDQTSVVLDVCCGVGTIGLCVAECAYKMMGVELTPSAIDDARYNAELNGVANAIFYNGKAEDYIESMIEKSQRANTIAIVDPPRAGLNGSVMNALRKCEYLDKLVYVSCDPQAALANFQALGRPRSKTYKGTYFVPVRAIPIDLFPDTPHYEVVILFERYDECKWDRIMSGNPRPKDQAYFDRVPELTYDPEKDLKAREDKRKDKKGPKGGRGGGGGAGAGGNWGRGGRRRDNYGGQDRGGWGAGFGNRGGLPGSYRQNFGSGFQEGFQAGLEALGNQYSGFGQGGGWNMAQTQEEDFMAPLEDEEDFSSMNSPMKGNLGGSWGYEGYDGPNSFGGTPFNSRGRGYNRPVTYPQSVTNPMRSRGKGPGFQSGGWSQGGSKFGGRQSNYNSMNNQMGSWSQNQYQSFEEPMPKKWKGGGMNSGFF